VSRVDRSAAAEQGTDWREQECSTMQGFDRITFDRNMMAGQACIRGMRIPVSLIVNLVARGQQTAAILEEYPDLEPEDIQQALEYAAWLTREQVYRLPL
jgi:uncharacterized protein (DUF433 family)